ncbi:MAG: hypothetical protein LBT24_03760, partial [Tannerella sp.]|nr:hypothetical protein [Tannerella sp.]
MDNKEFASQVEQKLKNLNREDTVKFAWVCAMRALPLLGTKGNFNYWKEKKQQKHLYVIFYALDLTISSNLFFNIADAYDARYAARYTAYDARSDAYAAYAADAAAYAASTDYAARDAARAAARAAANYLPLKEILLQDIDNIHTNKKLNNDKSIYGDIWDKFQNALKNEGCEYWGWWYETIFESGFIPDKDTLKRHLSMPGSIRSRGAAAVANYLTGLEEGAERLEARIIILGEKGAGKTCLARRLIDTDAPMTTDAESTAGVDTTLWKLKENNINAHIWDFAGHTITHAAHQFFLSERSLYILVYDGRTEERNRLEYWLDHIKIYGGNAPVFILINKRDQHTPEIPIHSLKDKYSIIDIKTFSIDTDKQDLENFRKTVADFITNNPSWNNQKIPATDYKVKTELEKLFKEGKDHIEYNEFEKIAGKYDIENKSELLKNLHVLGICLWYEKMQKFDTMVLNPEWISGGVYKIINWVHEQKKHEIALTDFRSVFEKDARYPENQDAFLFKLMIQYELAFETQKGGRLIIPHLLHEDRPAELPVFDIDESLMLRYKAEQTLPPDTISRFIVRRNEDIRKADGEYKVWRHGVVLKNGQGDIAMVLEDDRTISISVKGSGKTAYLDELRNTMNEIFESYKNLKIEIPEMQYKVVLPEKSSGDLIRHPLFLSANRLLHLSQANRFHYDDVLRQDIDPKPTIIDNAIGLDTILDKRDIVFINFGTVNFTNKEENIDNSTHNTYNFYDCNISLQGNLNDLASSLKRTGNKDEAEQLEEAAEVLESVESCKTPEEVKKKGVLNKVNRILEDLGDENSKLHKTVKVIKKGIGIAQDIAKGYNSIAQWAGLPQVPTPFLK